MLSEKMLEDAADLAARGIVLSPREVVRLNAFGLRAERGPSASALFHVRRACICHGLALHEPTIGHFVWLTEAGRLLDVDDSETWCYTRAYWLSVADPDRLANPDDRTALRKAIDSFARKRLARMTLRELHACMDYVEHGADADDCEEGPHPRRENGETCDELPAADWCSEIGVVREAQALGLGVSLRDAMHMTHGELRAVVDRAYSRICGDGGKQERLDAVGDYDLVLAEIVKAHETEGATHG